MTNLTMVVISVGGVLDLALAALPILAWLHGGRDPYFTDDDSVLMPSPPPDFTPALASVVMAGRATRRTISAGLMDLASRNLIAFRPEPTAVGHRAGLDLTTHRPRHVNLPGPEAGLYGAISDSIQRLGPIRAIFLGTLSRTFSEYIRALDALAVERGWTRGKSGVEIYKWRILAGVEAGFGVVVFGGIASALGSNAEVSALAVAAIGLGAIAAAAVTFLVSGAMPARTPEGAKLAAMLNAYRRTLSATIAQAQTIEQVVVMKPLPWVGTPTEEIAWAVAFGLDGQIDSLLSQSLEVSEAGGWPTGLRDWFSVI